MREVRDDDGYWTLHLSERTKMTSRFVIGAVGGYINPKPSSGSLAQRTFRGILSSRLSGTTPMTTAVSESPLDDYAYTSPVRNASASSATR